MKWHVDGGKMIREVVLARFGLPLPEQPGQELEVRVALIRDLRRLVPKAPSSEEEPPMAMPKPLLPTLK